MCIAAINPRSNSQDKSSYRGAWKTQTWQSEELGKSCNIDSTYTQKQKKAP
jgi:hypothetical protein